MTKPTSRLLLLASLVTLVAVLGFSGACGDDDDNSGSATSTATTRTTATATTATGAIDISNVPELADGKLTVGSDIAYPPIEYYEEGTQNAVGLDVDLMRALAAKLGVDFEFKQVADFAGIVGDLKASRYDVVMSAISITDERAAEIDFVPYFGPAGTGVLVPAGNPDKIAEIQDICGLSVAAQVGTIQIDYMTGFNENECAANKIDIKPFPDTPAAFQELNLGRVDAALADDPVAAYAAAQSHGDVVEVAATKFDSALYGIGVRKDSTELNTALTKALAAIQADGTYDSILADWGQTDFAYHN